METIQFTKFPSSASLEKYLVDNALKTYANLFGQPTSQPYPLPAVPTILLADGSPRSNTTNTQVNGVDEADLIETDGKFIYQANGKTLTIVDIKDRSTLKIASQLTISAPWEFDAIGQRTASNAPLAVPTFTIGGPSGGWNNIDGLYLQGDRLTVISTGWAPIPTASNSSILPYPGWYGSGQPQVQVTVLDVADPNHVSILEVSVLEGNLVSSRAIEDEVFVVTSNGFQLPAPLVIPDSSQNKNVLPPAVVPASPLSLLTSDFAPFPYPINQGTYETKAAYLARIQNQILDLGLPNVVTRNTYGQVVESGLLSPATEIYKPWTENSYKQLLTVSTFDVGDNHLGVDQVKGIPTEWVNNVFVSAENLYLLQANYSAIEGYSTKILQIDLETSELLAIGEVPGSIDSRFSVDEQGGFLRISTTTGFGTTSRNNVYILDQVGQHLDVVGKIEGLAPGERIFSTRFQGDYGFVVTFRQVDPLFTLDLSDPTNPRVAGELKIPGFSEYLQVIEQGDKTLLLGIGKSADPLTGRAQALKVSLFDVTNLQNPVEIDSYIFDGEFSSSDALWDNKAVTYVSEQRLLAIPTQRYNVDRGGSEARLTVFSVDAKNGIDRLGEVSHDNDWINRSVSIRNDLYAVSSKRVSAYDVPGLKPLGDVQWKGDQGPINYLTWATAAPSMPGFDDVATAQRSGLAVAANTAAESLFGDSQNDWLDGGAGNDLIYGNGGKDVLIGGLGDDDIYGASGNEWFDGGGGSDTLYLNGGEDVVVLRSGDGSDSIHGFDVGRSKLALANGLTFANLSFRQEDGFTSIRSGNEQLARVNWVDAGRLNQASNFIRP